MMKRNSILFVALTVIQPGCKSSGGSDGSDRSDDSASNQVSIFGPSPCEKNVKQMVTPDRETYLYHWTRDIRALEDPISYMNDLVEGSRKRNETDLSEGLAGAGLYLAADPFSSRTYGNILLTVPIKPRSSFALLSAGPSLDAVYNTYKCRSILYPYTSIYNPTLAVALTETRKIIMNRAKIGVLVMNPFETETKSDFHKLDSLNLPIEKFLPVSGSLLRIIARDYQEYRYFFEKEAGILYLGMEFPSWNEVSKSEPAVKNLESTEFYKEAQRQGLTFGILQLIVSYFIAPNPNSDQGKIFSRLAGVEFPDVSLVIEYLNLAGFSTPQMESYDALRKFLTSKNTPFPNVLNVKAVTQYIDKFAEDHKDKSMAAWK